MDKSKVIYKNKPLLPSQDYAGLRQEGIEYLQKLSGGIWTDHNSHDPGITTLETLAYALTDLGYRTSFSDQDLLTPAKGHIDPKFSGFFPAPEILTNTPLTINDYRKLLLKIEGIRNAWLDPMMQTGTAENEIPIYLDYPAEQLSTNPINQNSQVNQRLHLTGLYKVLLELEIDDELGSLNNNSLLYQVKSGILQGQQITLHCFSDEFLQGEMDFTNDASNVTDVSFLAVDEQVYRYSITLDNGITLDDLRITTPISELTEAEMQAELTRLLEPNDNDTPALLFWTKQQIIARDLENVRCVLMAHRNLCEDFLQIKTVDPQLIGICADIRVSSESDLEQIQAQVFFAIEQYFNPPIEYYSLQELLDAGWSTIEIFNGPYINYDFSCNNEKVFTKPGFIKNEQLNAAELRKIVYSSDIINEVMDIPGVLAVSNIQLRPYDTDNQPTANIEHWCLAIPDNHQPVLHIPRSKLLFFKDDIPYLAQEEEFIDTLDYLRRMAEKKAYTTAEQNLVVPIGKQRDTLLHVPVQHDFPQTYGIGEAGLPVNAPADRVIAAQQLKGYLTFFEQILADYLAQLSHLPDLFSLDEDIQQSYFSQYLIDIAGTRQGFAEEFYTDATSLKEMLDSGNSSQRNPLQEDEVIFQDRKNRLLDHMIARFSEQFTDYVLMMYQFNNGDRLKTDEQLITDKIRFLQDYPQISRERNQAFNYQPQNPTEIWDSENVSGLQKRASRLTALSDYSRRDLACSALFGKFFRTRKNSDQFHLVVLGDKAKIIFRSQELFADKDAALQMAEEIFPLVHNQSIYQVDDSAGEGAVVYQIKHADIELTNDFTYQNQLEALNAISELVRRYDQLLQSDLCNSEGLYLIEHLLLRPFSTQDALIPLCLGEEADMCASNDPYSFRASVVLPYWPLRFQDTNFRQFFERTVREQAPAHIHIKFCWISNAQMQIFQEKYQAWLQVKAQLKPDLAQLSVALEELLAIMTQLKTIYPASRLQDCIDDDEGSPVRLGSTNLGNF